MLVLWYSPFPDGSFTDSVTQFVADTTTKIVHKNTAKYYKFKAHLPNGQDELKDLPSGTRLYIIGHGDTSQGHISGDKPVELAAVSLARPPWHGQRRGLRPRRRLRWDGSRGSIRSAWPGDASPKAERRSDRSRLAQRRCPS